jgi:hypothetical protein
MRCGGSRSCASATGGVSQARPALTCRSRNRPAPPNVSAVPDTADPTLGQAPSRSRSWVRYEGTRVVLGRVVIREFVRP